MRLYPGKISTIASEIIADLVATGDIEVEDDTEARLDIESILKEYVRLDRDISDEAKSRLEARGLSHSNLGRIRTELAKERNVGVGESMIPHLVDQIMTMLFHSSHVAEVYAEDVQLRKVITKILREHTDMDAGLDAEVRGKIKNLEEGTATFEIEYARAMDEIKRKKGLV